MVPLQPRAQRDTRMVKLLLRHGASRELPFLLDLVPLRAGSVFATKASRAGYLAARLPACACSPLPSPSRPAQVAPTCTKRGPQLHPLQPAGRPVEH